jgi:hypothetical protein
VPELGIDPLKDNIKFIVASSDDPASKYSLEEERQE